MFIINILKNVAIYSRKTIKILVLVALAVIFIGSIVFFYYKPTYAVTLNGEFVGYTDNKSNMQKKINKYINAEEQSNVAFIQVDQMPEYKLCLLKKNVNCEEIEKNLREKFEKFAWVSCELKGTQFIIHVKESVINVNKKEIKNPCSIMANRSGEILSIITIQFYKIKESF